MRSRGVDPTLQTRGGMKLVAIGVVLLSSVVAACGGAVETGAPASDSDVPEERNTPPNAQAGSGTGTSEQGKPPEQTGRQFPEPSFRSAAGCGDFEVYATDGTGKKLLVIDAQKEALGLSKVGDKSKISLSTPTSSVGVRIDVYDDLHGSEHHCTDDGTNPPKLVNTFKARAGTLRVEITSVGPGDVYTVTVGLEDVELVDEDGNTEFVTDVSLEKVKVGWFPG